MAEWKLTLEPELVAQLREEELSAFDKATSTPPSTPTPRTTPRPAPQLPVASQPKQATAPLTHTMQEELKTFDETVRKAIFRDFDAATQPDPAVTNPYDISDWKALTPAQARERLQAIPAYDEDKRKTYDALSWSSKLTTAPPPGLHPNVRESIVDHLQDIAGRDNSGRLEDPHWLLDPPQMLANMYPQAALMGIGVASKQLGQGIRAGTETLVESAPAKAVSAWLRPYGEAVSTISEALGETPLGQTLSRWGQEAGKALHELHGRIAPTFLRPEAKEASYPLRHYSSETRLNALRNQMQLREAQTKAEARLQEIEQAWHDAWVARYGSEPEATTFVPRQQQRVAPTAGQQPPVPPLWGGPGTFKWGYIPEPDIPVAEQASWFEYAMQQGYKPPMGGPNGYPALLRNQADLRSLRHTMPDNPSAAELGREKGLVMAIGQQQKYLAESAYQYMMHRRPLDQRLQDYIPAHHKPLPFQVNETDPILNPPPTIPLRPSAQTSTTDPLWLTRQDAERAVTLAKAQGFTPRAEVQEALVAHEEAMDRVWQDLSAPGGPESSVEQRFLALLRAEDKLTRELGQDALTWLLDHSSQNTPVDLLNQHPWAARMRQEPLPAHDPKYQGTPYPSHRNTQLHFYDSMEHGLDKYAPDIEQQLQAKLSEAHRTLAQMPQAVQDDFLWNYWPSFWGDKGQAERILEEIAENTHIPTTYRQRLLESNVEAMQSGLNPRASNPVQHILGELNVFENFFMVHRALKAQEELGLVRFIPDGGAIPENWVRLPRDVGQTLSYETGKVTVDRAGAGVRQEVRWYAPEDVAQVWKNWTSRGLRDSDTYDFLRRRSNAMIMFRLGLSGFHAMAESLYAMTSDLALGLMELSEGRLTQGVQSMGRGMTPYAVKQAFTEGRSLMQEAMFPGSMPPEVAEMVANLTRGGMDFQRNAFYNNAPTAAGNMWRQMQTHPLLRTLEKISEPLMGKFVPAVKLGAAARLAQEEMARLGPGATEQQIRAAMARVVDSVDNRFGLLAYDNLFWNRTLKDLSHLMVQSVGWNLGSMREAAGGVFDLGKAFSGTDPVLSSRTAFVMALPFLTGIYGGMMHYLMTGERPQEMKDYYFPKTGRRQGRYEERVKLPTYMYDATHIVHSITEKGDMTGWATGKMNPLLVSIYELLHNEDFFGLPIRGEHGLKPPEVIEKILERFPEETRGPLRSLWQNINFLADAYIPYSVGQVTRGLRHEDVPLTIGGALGITGAPGWLQRSEGQEQRLDQQQGRRIDRQRQRLNNR